MPRSFSQKKNKRQRSAPKNPIDKFPEHLKKEGNLYLEGVVESSSRSFYFCKGENGMDFLCTSNKLDNLRIKVITGDRVVIEVPLLALEPDAERQRGRIVFRYKTQH